MRAEAIATDQDIRGLLDVLDRARDTADHRDFPVAVLEAVRELIPCDDITFQLMDVHLQRVHGPSLDADGVHDLTEEEGEQHDIFWSAFWEFGGCSYPQETLDYTTVLRQSDRHSDGEFATTAMSEYFAETGIRHEVQVSLAPQGTIDRRLLLFRLDGADFTDREVLLLRMLRPHIDEIHLRQQRLTRGEPELTPRQWEILRRVSTGATNAQVARQLHVSEATVRKHLENIFFRLDVASRTEAVARVAPFLHVA